MELKSNAFEEGQAIPARYTCEGEDISPPLQWTDVPEGTGSLAIVFDDPNSTQGLWTHWIIFDIPPDMQELSEDVPAEGILSWGGIQGQNDFGTIGYGGPCPAEGETHRYYFRLYALDAPCALAPGTTRLQFYDWAHVHILEETELIAHFGRE